MVKPSFFANFFPSEDQGDGDYEVDGMNMFKIELNMMSHE